MADGKKVIRDDVKDHYESQVRSANYLPVAHAAGLLGCLSVLKDYATTPQLKGMGSFVVLFGVGLICAIINYIGIAFTVMAGTSQDPISRKGTAFVVGITVFGFACGIAALIFLFAAIATIIFRFSSL
jgi:hypothetical protein